LNEKNIVDSLCDSIENNSQIINFKLVDRKHLNLKDNLMTWKIYAFIQLKDIGTSFDKYIEDMNEFMNSFKFNYDERTLNLDYIKQFTYVGQHKIMRGEIAYSFGNSALIDQSINNWPKSINKSAQEILNLHHIHAFTYFNIRPVVSTIHIEPEAYDEPIDTWHTNKI